MSNSINTGFDTSKYSVLMKRGEKGKKRTPAWKEVRRKVRKEKGKV